MMMTMVNASVWKVEQQIAFDLCWKLDEEVTDYYDDDGHRLCVCGVGAYMYKYAFDDVFVNSQY